MRITAHAPDGAAFAAFGTFIDMPARAGERQTYSDWLAPVPGLSPQFYTNLVAPSALPLRVERVERHPRSTQVFLPLKATRYLVVVMPALADGRPDAASAQAFLMPATLGVAYRAGAWHSGITALDGEASFAVLMWRGALHDDVFADIPPVIVEEVARLP